MNMVDTRLEEVLAMRIFKFFSMKALIPLLKQGKLFIDRVKTWEDVYENFFLKENFYSKSLEANIDTAEIAHGVFGQSWTYAPETDAMWRIYSADMHGVRIQTTVGKLFSAVFVDDTCIADTWLGKVEYNSMDEINCFIKKETEVDSSFIWRDLMPYTLFLKRTEFAHEKEFRIVKMLDSEMCKRLYDYKRLAFEINVNDFIEGILLDPRLEEGEFEAQKQELINLGIKSEIIEKSSLYHFEPLTIMLE